MQRLEFVLRLSLHNIVLWALCKIGVHYFNLQINLCGFSRILYYCYLIDKRCLDKKRANKIVSQLLRTQFCPTYSTHHLIFQCRTGTGQQIIMIPWLLSHNSGLTWCDWVSFHIIILSIFCNIAVIMRCWLLMWSYEMPDQMTMIVPNISLGQCREKTAVPLILFHREGCFYLLPPVTQDWQFSVHCRKLTEVWK